MALPPFLAKKSAAKPAAKSAKTSNMPGKGSLCPGCKNPGCAKAGKCMKGK